MAGTTGLEPATSCVTGMRPRNESADNKEVTKDGISACTNACTGEAKTGDEKALDDLAAKVNSLSESDRQNLLRLLGEDSK